MFRLVFFLLGILTGFIAAIFFLPLQGKTFFNKMSQLPKPVQDLIDDGINIIISFSKMTVGLVEDLKYRVVESSKVAEKAMQAVREKNEVNE